MLDIGGTIPDPTDGSLVLSMIDHGTLNAISNFTKKVNLGSALTLKEAEEAAFGHQDDLDEDDAASNQGHDERKIISENSVSMTGRSAAGSQG